MCQRCGFAPQVAGGSVQIDFILKMVRHGVWWGALLSSSQLSLLDLADFCVLALVEPVVRWRIVLCRLRGSFLATADMAWLHMPGQGAPERQD